MTATKRAGARNGTGRSTTPKPRTPVRTLPPITVAKLEETGRLLERVVSENQSLFVQKGQDYRDVHRQGSSRPLSALEAAQIAMVLARENESPLEKAQEVSESTLRAYDEPADREILMAAGIGVAPAFSEAVRQAVALVEMPSSEFEEKCIADERDEPGALAEAIEERAKSLRFIELGEGRKRASEAFAHYAKAAGFEPGEAWSLPVQAVWQALQGAMSNLTDASQSSQLIDSAASTEGSPEPTSSTASVGPTPSS